MRKILAAYLCIFLSLHLSAQDKTGVYMDDGNGNVISVGDSSSIVVGDDSSSDTSTSTATSQSTHGYGTYTLDQVPNNKLVNNSYVSDPDNYLQASTIAQINNILAEVEKKTTDQVALVVLNSIGYEEPKDFATRLFNKWGIGVKGKNNGLLILMVMDQRRVEFETGYGMESMLPDAICKRIEMNYMIPEFKAGSYDKGLLEGIKATADILTNPENSAIAAELKAAIRTEQMTNTLKIVAFPALVYMIVMLVIYFDKKRKRLFRNDFPKDSNDYRAALSRRNWIIIYGVIPGLFILYIAFLYSGISPLETFIAGTYIIAMIMFIEKRLRMNKALESKMKDGDYYANYKKYEESHSYWWIATIFFPIVFIFYAIYASSKKRALRNHPRNCKSCSNALVKLSETEDDQHLKKSQLTEENIGSVDYDVWLCRSCNEKEIYGFDNFFSKYSKCTSCGAKTYYLVSDRTIVSPTYTSTGTGCKTYKCKHCGAQKESTYTIAMKVESDSSSSSSGGGGSSGGSWGGGSSGGGGAGSSW